MNPVGLGAILVTFAPSGSSLAGYRAITSSGNSVTWGNNSSANAFVSILFFLPVTVSIAGRNAAPKGPPINPLTYGLGSSTVSVPRPPAILHIIYGIRIL